MKRKRKVKRKVPHTRAEVVASRPGRRPNQTPVEERERGKLTVHLERELVERVKNAAYWNPRLTIARIAAQGIREVIEKVETENGGPYRTRESELVGGRPIK